MPLRGAVSRQPADRAVCARLRCHGEDESGGEGRVVELDPDNTGDPRQISVLGEECGFMAAGHRGDEAVHHSPGRDAFSPASPVDAGGSVEVGSGIECQEIEAQEEPAQRSLPLVVPGAGHDLHQHRLGDGQRALVTDQLGQPEVDGAAGGSVEFDPSRRVRKDHSDAGA